MSYASLLARAARQAQAILAPLADPSGEGTVTIDGTEYTGTAASAEPEFEPGPNGLRRVESLRLVLTKAQFDTAPSAAPRANVVFAGSQYWCTKVDDDSLHYFLTCVPA